MSVCILNYSAITIDSLASMNFLNFPEESMKSGYSVSINASASQLPKCFKRLFPFKRVILRFDNAYRTWQDTLDEPGPAAIFAGMIFKGFLSVKPLPRVTKDRIREKDSFRYFKSNGKK